MHSRKPPEKLLSVCLCFLRFSISTLAWFWLGYLFLEGFFVESAEHHLVTVIIDHNFTITICVYVCMYLWSSHIARVWINRVRFVANPARDQLNRENKYSPVPVPENLVSRDGFSRPVPRQPAHLHTQPESSAYLRDSSRVPRRSPFTKPPYAIGSVPILSGHAIAYRWRSLPRVRRHRASKPQGSSERVPPWQVTMGQLICVSLSHTHYWYEVGMLKEPAECVCVCVCVCSVSGMCC